MGNSAITSVNLGVPAFTQSFVDGDLSSGVLTVTHNLNSQYVSVTVYNNSDLIIIPDDVDATGANALTIDLTAYGTLTGTWQAVVIDKGATQNQSPLFVDIGSFDRDSSVATGTQGVTGVGFQPRAVIFLAAESSVVGEMSIGFDKSGSRFVVADRYNNTANTWVRLSSQSIKVIHSGSDEYSGNIQSMDADGFTISWIKTGSPTGTFSVGYMAFR